MEQMRQGQSLVEGETALWAGGWRGRVNRESRVAQHSGVGAQCGKDEQKVIQLRDLEEQQQSSMRRKQMQSESMLVPSWSLVLGGNGGDHIMGETGDCWVLDATCEGCSSLFRPNVALDWVLVRKAGPASTTVGAAT